ncbi:MAG: hypothetical protein JNK58_05080 [Phycisphaerae bacterium]|nr:hypothetical protein [Phycisphaerae bacterium]
MKLVSMGSALVIGSVMAVVVVGVSPPRVGAQPAQGPHGPGERAPVGPPVGPPAGGPGGAAGEVSVSRSMKGMGRALKAMKSHLGDATKKDECLKLVNDFQRGIVNAKGQTVPEDLLAGLSESDREKKTSAFRRELMTVLRTALDLEADIFEGRTDMAKEKLDALIALRDKGHDLMGLKEE